MSDTPLHEFEAEIRSILPECRTSMDLPLTPDGMWWLDITLQGRVVVAQHQHCKGLYLGVSLVVPDDNDEGLFSTTPSHEFEAIGPALKKAVELLRPVV